MGRNRKLTLTSGPSGKGLVDFRPLSGDANPLNGVRLQGPDSVGASPLDLTLPPSVVDKGVLKTSSAGIITSELLKDENVKSDAAIALSKLAALTINRALVSDGSGVVSASAVTSVELGYLSGVTSAIQTQINNITASAISALTGDVTATGPGSVVATIAAGAIDNSKVNAAAAIAYSKLALALSVKAGDVDVQAAASGRVLTSAGSGNAPTWEVPAASATEFHISGPITDISSAISSVGTFVDFDNANNILAFTTILAGKYKVYASAPIQANAGAIAAIARIHDNLGNTSSPQESWSALDSASGYIVSNQLIQSVYDLAAGTYYEFKIQGQVTGGTAYLQGSLAQCYIFAERMTP